MFQATFKGKIVADGKTMQSLRNDFAHEAAVGGLDFLFEDCDVAEYLVGGDQVEEAYQVVPVFSPAERFLEENRMGITEVVLREFCEDGIAEDLTELAVTLESVGAYVAAQIVRSFSGL